MEYKVNIAKNQSIGLCGQILMPDDTIELSHEDSRSKGVQQLLKNGILTVTPKSKALLKQNWKKDMNIPRIVSIVIRLGLGDLVFIEPGIRLLLMNGVSEVHLYCRNDGMNIYHDYPEVTTHPLSELKQSKFPPDMPVVHISAETHRDVGYRAAVFAESIVRQVGISASISADLIPALSVAPIHEQWAETYLNGREDQNIILWQMESSRLAKGLPRETSMETINLLLQDGNKVVVLTNNHQNFPRHKDLKLLRGIPIERFMGICKHVSLVVSLDSAPSWIAGAVGADTIAIFGPTDPALYCPDFPAIQILQWNSDCLLQPCGDVMPDCEKRVCMDIPAEDLAARIMEMKDVGSVDFAVPTIIESSDHNDAIAILGLEGLGGTVALSHIAQAVKDGYPDKKVTLIVRNYAELFDDNPYVDDVICVGAMNYADALIIFTPAFYALADIRFGVGKWHGNIQNDLTPELHSLYENHPIGQAVLGAQGKHYLQTVCESLELPSCSINTKIYFDIPESEMGGEYIVITNGVDVWHKGGTQTKCWPFWEALVASIDNPFVQVGTRYDMKVPGARDMRGKTGIKKMCSILKNAHTIIVTEGGLTHVAYALECENVIVLRGPTASPLLQYPGQLYLDSMVCEPCLFTNHDWYKTCSNGLQEAICMKSITVERVVMAYENMVSSRPLGIHE